MDFLLAFCKAYKNVHHDRLLAKERLKWLEDQVKWCEDYYFWYKETEKAVMKYLPCLKGDATEYDVTRSLISSASVKNDLKDKAKQYLIWARGYYRDRRYDDVEKNCAYYITDAKRFDRNYKTNISESVEKSYPNKLKGE